MALETLQVLRATEDEVLSSLERARTEGERLVADAGDRASKLLEAARRRVQDEARATVSAAREQREISLARAKEEAEAKVLALTGESLGRLNVAVSIIVGKVVDDHGRR